MGLKDLFITPIYLVLFTVIAYFIRPYVTNRQTRKYFLPALWVRFGGAIALGIIYQFYYGRGDTFEYFDQATIVYNAILDNPVVGLKLIFTPYVNASDVFIYASKIHWYNSVPEFTIIRIVAIIGLFTFHTYLGTSLFFAFFAFTGSWLMFNVFIQRFAIPVKWVALSTLFIPSVIFWGSGILKDTITLSALGIAFAFAFKIIEERKATFRNYSCLIISLFFIYLIKVYILLCFIPSIFLWWYLKSLKLIKKTSLRFFSAPILLGFFLLFGYTVVEGVTYDSERYNLGSLPKWVHTTSYDIRYWTGKDAGSGYDIGAQDGTWKTLISLVPAAVNVSLFRPYLWEVNNPLMLLASLEGFSLMLLTVMFLFKFRFSLFKQPIVIFIFVFSITFAFAVGTSTYNFGSLNRYKIPMLPFYTSLLVTQLKSRNLVD